MKNILVVYHSRTGITNMVARELASACNADLEPIKCEGNVEHKNYLTAVFEAGLHLQADIQTASHPPEDYDLVMIGTPIWCWNVSSPVRTYLEQHRHQFKQLAFFCTYGGSGYQKVFEDMEDIAGQAPIDNLALTDAEIKTDQYHEKIKNFVDKVTHPFTQTLATARGNHHVHPRYR
jgi:flavodoxin